VTPHQLLAATTLGAEGQVRFPTAALQNHFTLLVPARLRRTPSQFVLIAAMHAAIHSLNHRYLSRQAVILGLHGGDAEVLQAAMGQTRPDFALLLLPAGADAPAMVRHLVGGPRRIEAVLCTRAVTAADRHAVLAEAGADLLVQVFADPTEADAEAGAITWRPKAEAPPEVGLFATGAAR